MEKQQGFNVIELMILIVIIAVLTAITLPIYQYYIAKSQVTAALIDITPGKVQTEVRLAGGMPSTTSPMILACMTPPLGAITLMSVSIAQPQRAELTPSGITQQPSKPQPQLSHARSMEITPSIINLSSGFVRPI